MKQLLVRLRERFRAFSAARAGNVTITFALATIPIIGAVGVAVDYSHVNSARTAMQSAVDATALMLSKDISTLTTSQINQKATSYFTALYTRPEVTNIAVKPTYTDADGTQIVVAASGTVKASFTSLIGVSQINIGASSTVKWGNSRLHVALVLDNTGSMANDGKMSAMQTATKNLLNQLKGAAVKNGDVYVSIIPFAKDVNLDKSNKSKNWIDWTEWDAANGSCSNLVDTTKGTCTAKGTCSVAGYTTQSACTAQGTCSVPGYTTESSCEAQGTCNNKKYTTESDCKNNGKKWTPETWTSAKWTSEKWTPANHDQWNGCVMDRGLSGGPSSGNYDTNVVKPTTSDVGTLFTAEQWSACPQPVMQLSYDWSKMTTLVNTLSPNGNTNQAIGVALGWMSLAGGGPFTVPAKDPKYKYQQVIILLTDGLNTQDRWYTGTASIDAREKMTCDNIKAAGITLYTVQVNTGNDPTSTLLQGCASDSSKFFLLKTASQMVTTFSTIGTQLSNLRVAK